MLNQITDTYRNRYSITTLLATKYK